MRKINITINILKKIENKLNLSSKDVCLFKKKVFNERDVRKKILKKFFKIFICSYRDKSALLKFFPGYNEYIATKRSYNRNIVKFSLAF